MPYRSTQPAGPEESKGCRLGTPINGTHLGILHPLSIEDGTITMCPITNVTRRKFIGAASIASLTAAIPIQKSSPDEARHLALGNRRARRSFELRKAAASLAVDFAVPVNRFNDDEGLYPNKIANYHKGLPHDSLGEVDLVAYKLFTDALASEAPADFENITLGGNIPLSDPQGGLAFELEGCDPQQTFMPPAPPLASAWRGAEAVEDYWMALLRDVNFADYQSNSLAQAAIKELNRLTDFRGPRQGGQITPQTLLRGFTPGDQAGPYVSQFLLQPVNYGGLDVEQRYNTFPAEADQLTRAGAWLPIQNGQGPFAPNPKDPAPRYIRNGRDLSAYIHSDGPIQTYLTAAQWLLNNGIPLNSGNPYNHSLTQTGFATFGAPHLFSLLGQAANCALRAVWYHKWFVHRTLRPEAYGGLVHWTMTGKAKFPVHPDALNSEAVDRVFQKFGTYFLPQAYVEGCPQHPSYGQGHAAIAGACVTILKSFFHTDSIAFPYAVQASGNGLSLVPYTGSDHDQLTLTNELHKLAGNVSLGRNMAGIHWRSDYHEALFLGEVVAISLLRDQRETFNESFKGFTFTKFDGTQATV